MLAALALPILLARASGQLTRSTGLALLAAYPIFIAVSLSA